MIIGVNRKTSDEKLQKLILIYYFQQLSSFIKKIVLNCFEISCRVSRTSFLLQNIKV